MLISPKINAFIEAQPLKLHNVIRLYNRLPTNISPFFCHYTSISGFKGILESGGLRATHRLEMKDSGEFSYARKIIDQAIDEIEGRTDSLADWCRKTLDNLLSQSEDDIGAYCACLTFHQDERSQWHDYGDAGKGVAISFNMPLLLIQQCPLVEQNLPYYVCAPIIYEEEKQKQFVCRLFETGIEDLRDFAANITRDRLVLTAFQDHVMREIVVLIKVMSNFIKHPDYAKEREMRVVVSRSDGSSKAENVQRYLGRTGKPVPYILFDLRNGITGRLPLWKIIVGPNLGFKQGLSLVESILDRYGYGSDYYDRPPIVMSCLQPF